jgi:DegV family protein with EDD domain
LEKIAILVDSGSDISPEMAEKFGIYMIPFYINLEGEYYKEHQELTPKEFYNWIEENESLPRTSTPSPGELLEKFKQIQSDGYEKVIVITISKELSSFYNLCMQTEYDGMKIGVVNSKILALNTGFLAIYAKQLVDQGMAFEEIIEELEKKKMDSEIYFTIGTFRYIVSGGRVPKVFGKIGDLLSIRPIITCSPEDGKFHIVKTVRGEKRLIREFEKIAEEKLENKDSYYMHISNGGYGSGQKLLEKKLKNYRKNSKLFLSTVISPTLGAHTGPGLFGFGFLPLD